MESVTNSEEVDEKIPRTVYLKKRHLKFLERNSIHFSPFICNTIDQAIEIEKRSGKTITKILQDEIDAK